MEISEGRSIARVDAVLTARQGCAPAVLAEVARLAPRAIANLTCNPTTLARDLAPAGRARLPHPLADPIRHAAAHAPRRGAGGLGVGLKMLR
jgi:hypothetical protein